MYNIKPKEYGVNPQRKRRFSELDGYDQDDPQTSVFNKDRIKRRAKNNDEDSSENQFVSLTQNQRSLQRSNPFKKNGLPFN